MDEYGDYYDATHDATLDARDDVLPPPSAAVAAPQRSGLSRISAAFPMRGVAVPTEEEMRNAVVGIPVGSFVVVVAELRPVRVAQERERERARERAREAAARRWEG